MRQLRTSYTKYSITQLRRGREGSLTLLRNLFGIYRLRCIDVSFVEQSDIIPDIMERNPCVASGCLGLCCQDIYLEITGPERREIFPTAQKVDSINQLITLKKGPEKGLFYVDDYGRPGFEDPDFCLLAINGPCPNRSPDGDCVKHDNREHVAKNFKIGCADCNAIRKKNGLAPIYIEPVE